MRKKYVMQRENQALVDIFDEELSKSLKMQPCKLIKFQWNIKKMLRCFGYYFLSRWLWDKIVDLLLRKLISKRLFYVWNIYKLLEGSDLARRLQEQEMNHFSELNDTR